MAEVDLFVVGWRGKRLMAIAKAITIAIFDMIEDLTGADSENLK